MFDWIDSIEIKYWIFTLFSLLTVVACLVCYILLKINSVTDIDDIERKQEALDMMITTILEKYDELKQSQAEWGADLKDWKQIKMSLLLNHPI